MMAFLKNNIWFHFAVITCLAFFIFYPSIFYELTNWDAPDLIEDNILIRSLSGENLKRIFGGFYWYNYQPLTLLSLAIEYHFFGINPKVIHLSNIVIHCLNAMLLYLFIVLLIKQKPVALLAALLWAVHPMRVESVTWVVERKDVLYTFFFFLAAICYVKYLQRQNHQGLHEPRPATLKRRRIYYSFALLFFILSCLAKGMAVSLTLLLPFLDFFLMRRFSFAAVADKIPFAAVSMAFGITVIFAARSNTLEPIVTVHSLWERILFACHAPFFYCGKFLYPVGLSALYSYKYRPGALPDFYSLFPFLLVLTAILVLLSYRFTRKIIFGFGFFFAAIALILPFHQTNVAPVADHYSYVGHAGLCLLFSWAIAGLMELLKRKFPARYKISQTSMVILLAGIIALLGYLTQRYIPVWKDSVSLWKHVLNNQISKTAFLNMGIAHQRIGKYKEALKHYTAAIHVSPTSFMAYNNRGNVKKQLLDFTGAESDFHKSLQLNPRYVKAYNNLGTLLFVKKNYDSAMVCFNKAIELSPDFHLAYYNRGNLLASSGNYEAALADFRKASALNPYNNSYLVAIGNIYMITKQTELSLEIYNKVLMLDSNLSDVWFRRGLIRVSLQDTVNACEDFYCALRKGFSAAAIKVDQFCDRYGGKYSVVLKDQPMHFKKILYPNGSIKMEFSDELVELPDSLWKFTTIKKLKHYDPKGNLIEEGIVDSAGKFHGEIKWFYRDGRVKISGFYKDTLPYGDWKEYYNTGTLMATYTHRNGKRDGLYTFYHPNGKIWTERTYKGGKFWKVISNYSSDGHPLDPGTLSDGNGTVKVYNEAGKLMAILQYRNGERIDVKR